MVLDVLIIGTDLSGGPSKSRGWFRIQVVCLALQNQHRACLCCFSPATCRLEHTSNRDFKVCIEFLFLVPLWILILTFQCYQYEESKSRLLLLSLDKRHAESEHNGLAFEFNASEKSRLLSAVVDLDARQAVCAAGRNLVLPRLPTFLQRTRVVETEKLTS